METTRDFPVNIRFAKWIYGQYQAMLDDIILIMRPSIYRWDHHIILTVPVNKRSTSIEIHYQLSRNY